MAAVKNLGYFVNTVRPAIADHWRRDSIALDYLESLDAAADASDDVGCGPTAFAAIAGISIDETTALFSRDSLWTNRTRMERALHAFGWDFIKLDHAWPEMGLCLIHWCGPWTERGYAHAILQRTHWVAVIADYVFDVNWCGWLPRQNWEDAVVAELLSNCAARAWIPLTGYELRLA